MEPIIEFSYLGKRSYLDITSILEALWTHFGFEFRRNVRDMEFRILSPIEENCVLIYGKASEVQNSKTEAAVAEFTWRIDDQEYTGYLVPNGQKITSRIPEPDWNFEDYCQFENNKVTLKNNFKVDVCYNLTKMGKFLISKFKDPNVRIVKFYFKELLPTTNMIGAQLRMVDLQKRGFIKIICEKDDIEFGYILVKSNLSGPQIQNESNSI